MLEGFLVCLFDKYIWLVLIITRSYLEISYDHSIISGYAGPRNLRVDSGPITSVTGIMGFDAQDIQRLVDSGKWEYVILHESK